jgi:hypothetical protein
MSVSQPAASLMRYAKLRNNLAGHTGICQQVGFIRALFGKHDCTALGDRRTNMTKKEKQKIWDEILIDQWQKDGSVMIALTLFLREVEPSLVGANGFINDDKHVAACEYMVSIELSRCLDSDGQNLYFNCRGPVRAFIAVRCSQINNILWSGRYSREEVVRVLPQFKWRRQVKAVLKSASENRRAAKMMGPDTLVFVGTRARDKRHNWNTVK